MTARGVLFAITAGDLTALDASADAEARVEYIVEEIERRWEPGFVLELDKAWDALHRCMSDGRLEQGGGEYPLNAAVLGRELLDAGPDYFVGLTRAADVPAVAAAVRGVDGRWIAEAYRAKVPVDYAPEYGDEDLDYTVHWSNGLPAFWRSACAATRSVIFTVDR